MITLTKQTVYGYVEYAFTEEEEINQLPKRGIQNGSVAYYHGEYTIIKYRFYQKNENEDGKWTN